MPAGKTSDLTERFNTTLKPVLSIFSQVIQLLLQAEIPAKLSRIKIVQTLKFCIRKTFRYSLTFQLEMAMCKCYGSNRLRVMDIAEFLLCDSIDCVWLQHHHTLCSVPLEVQGCPWEAFKSVSERITSSQPENSPSASQASYGSMKLENGSAPPSPSTSPSMSESAEDPAAEALQQIRSMRASSELDNRKRNNYEDRIHTGKIDLQGKWPVGHTLLPSFLVRPFPDNK